MLRIYRTMQRQHLDLSDSETESDRSRNDNINENGESENEVGTKIQSSSLAVNTIITATKDGVTNPNHASASEVELDGGREAMTTPKQQLAIQLWKPLPLLQPQPLQAHMPEKVTEVEAVKRPFKLPENWFVDVRIRANGKYAGRREKYYYEPVTKKLFRSLISVQRRLEGVGTNNYVPKQKKPISDLQFTSSPHSQSRKKNNSGTKKTTASNFNLANPSEQVASVGTGPVDSSWSKTEVEQMLAESIKNQWNATSNFVTTTAGNASGSKGNTRKRKREPKGRKGKVGKAVLSELPSQAPGQA